MVATFMIKKIMIYKTLYKLDFGFQKILSSLLFQIPVISIIKNLFYWLRFGTFNIRAGYNIVITNFDKKNNNSGIKFTGKCKLIRNIQIDTCGGITIGNNVTISENVNIQTHKHEFNKVSIFDDITSHSPLKIEDEVWICQNAIISDSVKKIGFGSVIAAGSVLTKDTGVYEIWGGVPAKLIKLRIK